MQIALMQNNSSENIIIKQTSENGDFYFIIRRDIVHSNHGLRFSSCFGARSARRRVFPVEMTLNDNLIMKSEATFLKHSLCSEFSFSRVLEIYLLRLRRACDGKRRKCLMNLLRKVCHFVGSEK